MHIAINLTLLVLNIMNILLHGMGSYLLRIQYRKGKKNPQIIFILNLSVCELIMNFLESVRRIIFLFKLSSSVVLMLEEVQKYVLIVMFTGISFVFYMDMLYLTIDRLLCILLNLNYNYYCKSSRAKYVLYITWTVGITMAISVSLAHRYLTYNWETAFFMYFYPTLEFAYIMVAFITYTVIFIRYRQSTRLMRSLSNRDGTCANKNEGVHMVRKTRFLVAIFLITSFILFMLIPDLVYLFYGVLGGNLSKTLLAVCWISYAISNLADGFIYIFLQPSIRRLLRIKLCCSKDVLPSSIRSKSHLGIPASSFISSFKTSRRRTNSTLETTKNASDTKV